MPHIFDNSEKTDAVLAKHYGFTEEELDYKYRMGKDSLEDSSDG